MTIDRELVSGVSVLTLRGKVILGDGDELLKACIDDLLNAGQRSFVLDMGSVPYIDSAGNGEFVRTFTTVSRQGGRVVFCSLSKRIADLWTISKLMTVYETYDSVTDAVRSFSEPPLEVSCPVCGPTTWTGFHGHWRSARCPECDGVFVPMTRARRWIAPSDLVSTRGEPLSAVVDRVSWIVYDGTSTSTEQVHLSAGAPHVIAVTGRLDLFALDIVQHAWQAVPAPRRVLVDLTGTGNVSDAARSSIKDVMRESEAGAVALLVDSAHIAEWLPLRAYGDRATAEAALGAIDTSRLFDVLVRRRNN